MASNQVQNPAPAAAEESPPAAPVPINLDDPRWYLNRELTWLDFCGRVLHEAEDERNPLLERVKFLAIVGSNLDEFFMKRIGGLKQLVGAGITEQTVDGRTPIQQIEECYLRVRQIEADMRRVAADLTVKLSDHGIQIISVKDVKSKEQKRLRALYKDRFFPLITPQAIDPAHPFPFISNLSLNLLVKVRRARSDATSLVRVKVPVGPAMPRFIKVPGRTRTFVRIEDMIETYLDLLLPGMDVTSCERFRVTRNAITEKDEDEADDLLELIQSELRERKFAPIVRLEVEQSMKANSRRMLARALGLDHHTDVFKQTGPLAMRDLFEIASIPMAHLHDPPHEPVEPASFANADSVFDLIRRDGSLLVHHPYQSFKATVERFLLEASRDPAVRAIKTTLYRTSEDTRIIDALIDAARHDKQVAVVVELKARFDESKNIQWANRLEEAGIHVTYGVVGLKTHCKVIYVLRQEGDKVVRYAHIGTGNYHAGTARLYSDFGFFTCDESITRDLTELFNYLTTGFGQDREYHSILTSPDRLKAALIMRCEREIENAQEGEKALIRMKINALEDADITRALYRASQAGVQVQLIVRDSCRLRPGIEGLSENISVISIVGQFLEHTRIYHFHNRGKDEYFIGSADAMKRNLESRVEVVAPVRDRTLQDKLNHFFTVQLTDQRLAWDMQSDGSFVQRQPANAEEARGSQERLIAHFRRRAGLDLTTHVERLPNRNSE